MQKVQASHQLQEEQHTNRSKTLHNFLEVQIQQMYYSKSLLLWAFQESLKEKSMAETKGSRGKKELKENTENSLQNFWEDLYQWNVNILNHHWSRYSIKSLKNRNNTKWKEINPIHSTENGISYKCKSNRKLFAQSLTPFCWKTAGEHLSFTNTVD